MHKTIALVAHDNRKKELMEWVYWNRVALSGLNIVCTGTTGGLIEKTLQDAGEADKSEGKEALNFHITRLKSGPLGGDQQMGAMVAEGKIDLMVFFWDPMQPQAHDVDVKALLRITVLYNVPTACNRSTADFLVSSSLFHQDYRPKPMDLDDYLSRSIEL
jgi:methylglyoxal synthase